VRRTALTGTSIALGVAAVVFAWSLFDGSNEQMIANMTSNLTGFVQVHRAGYADDPSLDRAFDPAELPAGIDPAIPGVTAMTARIEATALEHQAHAGLQRRPSASRVLAQDPDGAAVGRPVALQDLDRRRLAGPVRPEEGDELARVHAQRDAAEDGPRAVALDDALELEGGRRHGVAAPAGPEIDA